MKPKCRIKITLKCNKHCDYCINDCAEYRKKWKLVDSLDDIDFHKYRSVIISGGEPTIRIVRTHDVCRFTRCFTQAPIYLQTNGLNLTKQFVKDLDSCIDGVGYSIHSMEEFAHMVTRFEDILRIKPIRLYVEDKLYDENVERLEPLKDLGFRFRIWSDGEFDSTEDIYVLKEQDDS